MEQLKKNGYTTGRGRLIGAHADGTAADAFKDGTGTRPNIPNLKDVTTNNRAIQHAKNASKEAAEEKAEEEKEQFEEIFDWIERRIKNFQRKFDKWLNQAETALTKGFIDRYYKKAAKNIKKEASAYGKAYHRYMQEANAVGLDEKYAKKVRNGTIDIETIRAEGSEEDVKKYQDLADKIQKYQEWYDKAIESTTSFVETAEKLYHLPLDKAADKIEIFSDKIDLLDKKLKNAIGSKAKNDFIDAQDKQEKKTLDARKTAKKETNKNLKQAKKNLKSKNILSSPDVSGKDKKKIKDAVKNNKQINLSLFKEGSKAYNAAVKYNEALKARKQAINDCSAAQEEYNSWAVESNKLKFDNIADDFEKQAQLLGHQMTALDSRISEIEASGAKVNISYYESQKKVNDQMLATYQQEKNELEKSIGAIKPGTDEWYEAYDQIQQVSASISDCVKESYELNNAINQLHFELFEDISESIGRIITEQEFLQSLFAHEKLTDDKTGNLTEAGLAKLGSLSASYHASKNRADRDAAEVKELKRMSDSGQLHSDLLGITFNSMDDLKAKLDETYTTWQNDIKETYSLESDIAELMKEKYQAELDMLKELIDAKKDALNAEKDLHDYNRTISEKTKDISTIQKQIAAYSGDTSQEGLAKLQKLQKELADKQEDLEETEYDRMISDQQDMLDRLYEEYEELVTKKLDDFYALVKEGLGTANDNMAVIKDYLDRTADLNGYMPETEDLFLGLGNNIDQNVNRIINAIAANAAGSSGTIPNGQGEAVAGSAKPEPPQPAGTGTADAGTAGTPASSGQPDTDKINLVKDFIAGKSKKTKKAKTEFGAVNRRIYENESKAYKGTGRILEADELKELAKLLGVKYDNATKSGKLYKKLEAIQFPGFNNLPGFKNGGIISVDNIEKQVKANGDDGIVSVRNGEGVLTPKQVELLKKYVDKMPDISMIHGTPADMNHMARIPNPAENIKSVSNVRGNDINIDLGGISMYGVNDPKEFAEQLTRSVQTVPKVRNVIRSVSTDMIQSENKLGVKTIR